VQAFAEARGLSQRLGVLDRATSLAERCYDHM
jgi:hypothetical protein